MMNEFVTHNVLPMFDGHEEVFEHSLEEFMDFCNKGISQEIIRKFDLENISNITAYFNKELNIDDPNEMAYYLTQKAYKLHHKNGGFPRSYKAYRFKNNPEEKKFYDTFLKENTDLNGNIVTKEYDRICFGTIDGSIPRINTSERERRVMASTIQWLGSPVGRNFLYTCGYIPEKDFKPRMKSLASRIANTEDKLDKIPTWVKWIFL